MIPFVFCITIEQFSIFSKIELFQNKIFLVEQQLHTWQELTWQELINT